MDTAIAVGAGAVLVALAVAALRARNRPSRVGMIAAMPVLVVAFGVWWVFIRADVLAAVWVYGANAPDGGEFAIQVPNTRLLMTGATNTFKPQVSESDLYDAMRRQHPGTTVDGGVAHVIEDNRGYVLYADPDRPGVFTLEAEYITVTRDDAGYQIPFPSRMVTELDREGWTVLSNCDRACLSAYYTPFTNVVRTGDGFAVHLPTGSFRLAPDGDAWAITKL